MSTNTFNAAKWVSEICAKFVDEEYIHRGVNEFFDKEDDINSSIYRNLRKENLEFGYFYLPARIESEIVEKAKRLFSPSASNIEILTNIRHFGGDTTLIDFTHNLMVALFFTCNGKFDKDGSLISLSVKSFPTLPDINYTVSEQVACIIEPAPTPQSQSRTIAQSSVFIHTPIGYISRKQCNISRIEKQWKKPILDYLRKIYNISHDTIYNDLVGFIANEKNFKTASLYFYNGLKLYKSQEYEKAIAEYDEAIRLNPYDANIYSNRGCVKTSLGQYEQAIDDFDKSINLSPRFADAYYNRGCVKASLGQHEQAIDDFDDVIRLNPSHSNAYNNRGISKAILGHYEKSIDDFDRAIFLERGDAAAYHNRGNAKANLGQHQEAIANYDEAIRLNPNYADAYYNRGISKAALNLKDEAKADIEKALSLDPKLPKPTI